MIAINEGRLLDFLNQFHDRFEWLAGSVTSFFTEQNPPHEDWLGLVNLNLRALTLPGGVSGYSPRANRSSKRRTFSSRRM